MCHGKVEIGTGKMARIIADFTRNEK